MANTPPIIPSVPSIKSGPSGVASQQNPPPPPHLPPGTVVLGNVVGADAKGNPVIQGQHVQLVLGTKFPLDKGAQVSVRIDPPLTRDAMPSFRILSVDGKPPSLQLPASPQVPADAPANPVNPAVVARGSNLAAEQAKPVGLLLEVLSRPEAATGKTGQPAQPQEAAPQQPATRGVAAEVQLSAGQKTVAVLLRPSVSGRAANVLTQLANHLAIPLPASPTNALRPGLQLQLQVIQTPTPPQSPAAPSPTGQGQAAPSPAAPTSTSTPQATPSTSPTPPPAMQRSGYAQYAKQAPAMMSGSPPPAGVMPAASPAAPPPLSGLPQGTSPAMPLNVPANLTPQAVEQLLLRAEAQPLPQGQMAGVVMGKEPGGAVIVQTRLGMFTLPQVSAGSAQPGSVLTWQVNQIQMPAQTESSLPITGSTGALTLASQFTAEWSALDELSSLLHSMQSSMAAQTLQRMVPHVGGGFSAGLLFFMSVLRKGDVTEWMGRDMVDHLERIGKGDLIQRLGNDMAAVRSLFAEPSQSGWQALFFPVMVDKQLEHAQMYLKPDEQNKKDGSRGTRFIVELELSNLGPMQMDGLVKKRTDKTQFDLVIRSMTELPEQMKSDIYGIFENAQEVTGLQGGINFRLVQEFPVNPLLEMEQKDSGEGGIIA